MDEAHVVESLITKYKCDARTWSLDKNAQRPHVFKPNVHGDPCSQGKLKRHC